MTLQPHQERMSMNPIKINLVKINIAFEPFVMPGRRDNQIGFQIHFIVTYSLSNSGI